MANLTKVDESCLSEVVRKRRRLIEQIRNVAQEIEFTDDRDRRILARELDRRGVIPMAAKKWYRRESKNPCASLTRFLKTYTPELLHRRPSRTAEGL